MNILIVVGEKSADNHMHHVIKELKSQIPILQFWGTGGEKMAMENVFILQPISKLSCIGCIEPIAKLMLFHKLEKQIIQQAKANNTQLAILVDFGGFNLRLAKKLFANKIPVLYFITPKFWAWGASRINKIKKYVEHSAVILPFEAKLLQDAGIKATYVGNPIMSQIPKKLTTPKQLTLGIMPGSRASEIKRHLEIFIQTAKELEKKIPIKIILSKATELADDLFDSVKNIEIYEDSHKLINDSSLVLVASGTASLEVALMHKPMVIFYKTDIITKFLFRTFAKTKYIGLPNIIMQEDIVPELSQAKPEIIANELLRLIRNPNHQLLAFAAIKQKLACELSYSKQVASIASNILLKSEKA